MSRESQKVASVIWKLSNQRESKTQVLLTMDLAVLITFYLMQREESVHL